MCVGSPKRLRDVCQIHVVDLGDALAQRRREIEIRLQPREELILAQLKDRLVAVENHGRVVRVGDVDLRQPSRHLGLHPDRGDHARRELRACLIGHRSAVARRCREAVDDRQIEIGVLRAVLIDDHAPFVDEIRVAVDAPDPDRLPLRYDDFDG